MVDQKPGSIDEIRRHENAAAMVCMWGICAAVPSGLFAGSFVVGLFVYALVTVSISVALYLRGWRGAPLYVLIATTAAAVLAAIIWAIGEFG